MELSRRGVECVLLEKKALPRTKACGSGLSPWTLDLLDRLGVGPEVRAQAFRIDGAIIAGSEGRGLELRGEHETAVLRRSELDYLLATKAAQRGADLRDSVTVKGLTRGGARGVEVLTSEGPLEADLVIDASGATGHLDRYLPHSDAPVALPGGLRWAASGPKVAEFLRDRAQKERRTLHTIMGWYQGVSGCSDVVELFFDAELRPHYAWIFPETKERVNIGLCMLPKKGGMNAKQHFEAFLERRLSKRLKGAELLGKWIGHPVQVSAAAQGLVGDRVLRAGEAGWLADAATAEGIYHALLSGKLAGEFAAKQLLQGGDTSEAGLRPYEAAVNKALLGRLALGRALMSGLNSNVLDRVLGVGHSAFAQKALSRAFTGLYHG